MVETRSCTAAQASEGVFEAIGCFHCGFISVGPWYSLASWELCIYLEPWNLNTLVIGRSWSRTLNDHKLSNSRGRRLRSWVYPWWVYPWWYIRQPYRQPETHRASVRPTSWRQFYFPLSTTMHPRNKTYKLLARQSVRHHMFKFITS